MRITGTPEFVQARAAQKAAYAAYDKVAEDPNASLDEQLNGPESKAEWAALYRVLEFPATTPGEIAGKLAMMRERDIDSCSNGFAGWMAQIERELIELQRPCVSPAMSDLFNAWRDAWAEFNEGSGTDAIQQRHSAAYLAMMNAPCFTPGDFIVKVYANQLGEHGPTVCYVGGSLFELDNSSLSEGMGSHDGAAEEAFARDIRECDLGRCLLMLGHVDFEAEAWLQAAWRSQMTVYVVIQTDSSEYLTVGESVGETNALGGERSAMILALLGAGLGDVGKDRRTGLIAHIKTNYPGLVMDCRKAMGDAA